MINNFAKNLIGKIVQNNFLWKLFSSSIIRIIHHFEWKRKLYEDDQIIDRNNFLSENFPDLKVKHGYFKGMKYPNAKSFGSDLVPKLIGSYENELNPILDKILHKDYTTIVDIGCAEGFYAIGLSRIFKHARIYAYDINNEALNACRLMANLNDVQDRIEFGNFIDSSILEQIPFGNKALIISDCEGCEKELFTKKLVEKLRMHDFLIEVHDNIDITISTSLKEVFLNSHKQYTVKSIDDVQKVFTYSFPEIDNLQPAQKKILLGENRGQTMEWFFFEAK